MDIAIPSEYREYLSAHAVFEGFATGDIGYIALWSLEEIPGNNADLAVQDLAPGYLAFGGDGGGEVFAFDASGAVYTLPMIGMEARYANRVASSFSELAAHFPSGT